MSAETEFVNHTRKWIEDVVIGCNFCPFAAREVRKGSIYYEVFPAAGAMKPLDMLKNAFSKLDKDAAIETIFLIFPFHYKSFADYLKFLSSSEKMLSKLNYDGVYQIASFHPDYLFGGAAMNDAANYTNRSPYPMLHLLRESSVSYAVDSHPDAEGIPERNTAYAREKGLQYMQALWNSCMK